MIDDFDKEFRFLSNFWPDNNDTLEHRYQAAKTDDPEWIALILAAPNPREAKRLGRKCPARPTWDDEKLGVMLNLLEDKFCSPKGHELSLDLMLLDTGSQPLVEGNWWCDIWWGYCWGEGKGKRCKGHPPTGKNWLGRELAIVRAKLYRPTTAYII